MVRLSVRIGLFDLGRPRLGFGFDILCSVLFIFVLNRSILHPFYNFRQIIRQRIENSGDY